MTKEEQDVKDLNIDFLVKVSNAALECEDTKAGWQHSTHTIAAAIIISTPEGRNEFHHSLKTKAIYHETVAAMMDVYYDLAREKGVYDYIKNEERQLIDSQDGPSDPNPRGTIPSH